MPSTPERVGAADDERVRIAPLGQRDPQLRFDHRQVDHAQRAIGALLLALALLVLDQDRATPICS